MPRLYNLNSHKALRQQLRRSATPAERKLWRFLKNDQFHGYRFRRQFGIGRYIVDFYCPKLKLAIEIDGNIHLKSPIKQNDKLRQKILESTSICVVRFSNNQIMKGMQGVMNTLEVFVTSLSASPYPPSEFRRGT